MNYKEDYARAIFLEVYGNGKPLRANDEYQRYFEFECGITSPRSYHEKLIEDGYFQLASPQDSLLAKKVPELKEICAFLNLPKAGKKQELIDRIITNATSDQLNSFTEKNPIFVLSEKGTMFLNEHTEYIQLHKHKDWEIDLDEYIKFKQSLAFSASFKDITWGILSQRIITYSGQYYLLRNNYCHMSELMAEEHNYGESLKYLLCVLLFDVSYIDSLRILKYCNTKEEALSRFDCNAFKTSVITNIYDLKEYYSESYLDYVYHQYNRLPYSICDMNTFKNLVADILTCKDVDFRKYETIFRNHYLEYINKNFKSSQEAHSISLSAGNANSSNTDKSSAPTVAKSSGCLTSLLLFLLPIFVIAVLLL